MKDAINCILAFFEGVGRITVCFAPVIVFVSAMMWAKPWEWFA